MLEDVGQSLGWVVLLEVVWNMPELAQYAGRAFGGTVDLVSMEKLVGKTLVTDLAWMIVERECHDCQNWLYSRARG